MKDTYTKQLNKIIDLSDTKLPPIWTIKKHKKPTLTSEVQNDFFVSGPQRALANYIIELINAAQNSVVLSSFLFADIELENAVYNATLRGVRVYIMLACETRLEGDTPDDDFGKMCLEQHLKMLKRLGGKVLFRTASHFHSKVVLVDSLGTDNTMKAQGVLLTANLTTEALERNEELGVILSNQEVIEITRLLKWAMFEYAEHELLDTKDFSAVKPLNSVEFPNDLKSIINTSSMSNSLREKALSIINNAQSELIVSSFGWQEDHEVVNAIVDKAKQGVRVIILARIRPSSMDTLINLASAGAQVYGYRWLHAKAIWNDRKEGMVMSANLQKHGLDEGFEIGLSLHQERAQQLKICLESLYINTTKVLKELKVNSLLSEHLGDVEYWENNKLSKININKKKSNSLGEVIAECVTDLSKKAVIPQINWKSNPVHALEYVWSVIPPILPNNAKEILWDEKIEIKQKVVEEKLSNSGKEKEAKNKIAKPKFKTISHSYFPKAYSYKGKKMIAINKSSDLSKAIQLRDSDFNNATIVLNIIG